MHRIGIRREDKSKWEGRAPLTPAQVKSLKESHGIDFQVQSSPIRAFDDAAYEAAGARVENDLDACRVILAVKEIPPEKIKGRCVYVCFSHTIKGQPENMPLLGKVMQSGSTLIDYECIVDDAGRRRVFFGRFAGVAGMIDSLWSLGRRLQDEQIDNPFVAIEPAHRYADLAVALRAVSSLGEVIRRDGLPDSILPFVCGIAGYGNVSVGAQEVYDRLPVQTVRPDEVTALAPDPHTCYKVVFQESDIVRPADSKAGFDLQAYYDHPERFQPAFAPHARSLTMLINCIYWDARYPRLLTRNDLQDLYKVERPKLKVIGDITCDVDGSLACTVKATTPDNPVYLYNTWTGETEDKLSGPGPLVLAVDFLPCELPVDSSHAFGEALIDLVPSLARADFTAHLTETGLPKDLQRATIVHRGELTPAFQHLQGHL
ncbi:MAG: bifunctional lysine ketoglutarate reductase /saccharopine dehydrogenase family protein [Planctomycetota bacterium]|jgi:alpha-aminoadipic semialdehyde synthase